MTTLQDFALRRTRQGKVHDLAAGPAETRQADRRRQSRRPRTDGAPTMATHAAPTCAASAARRALRTLGFLSPWLIGFTRLLRLSADRHRLLLLHALQPAHAADLRGPARTGRTSSSRYRCSGPALRNTLWLVVVMVALPGRLRPRHRPADHQDQDGRGLLPHRLLPARTWPRRSRPPSPSSSCSTPAPARSTRSSGRSGIAAPELVQRPGLVQARR